VFLFVNTYKYKKIIDGKLIVLLLLMLAGIAYFFCGVWKILISLILFIINALYFIFVIFDNHTTTSDLLIPGLIQVVLYFWLDKAYKIDKKQ
jgi:hypothetical protein